MILYEGAAVPLPSKEAAVPLPLKGLAPLTGARCARCASH